MKCPHCQVEIHEGFRRESLTHDHYSTTIGKHGGEPTSWGTATMICPACEEAIIKVRRTLSGNTSSALEYAVYPQYIVRPIAPKEVPQHIADDFNESCLVVSYSPKASAALSRRCLQGVLADKGYNDHNLVNAIKAAIDSKQLPSSVSENLDAVRNIGNFAAHPLKNTGAGLIQAVEPHEAEWNLDVLEELFDFFYVQPERSKQRRAALDAKLAAQGKPPMKK